jgi:hypothetical protein
MTQTVARAQDARQMPTSSSPGDKCHREFPTSKSSETHVCCGRMVLCDPTLQGPNSFRLIGV